MRTLIIEDRLSGSFKKIPVDFGYVCINKTTMNEKGVSKGRVNSARKSPVYESGNLIRGYRK